MKPHLPVTLFHALIAALVGLPMAAHAELLPIPEEYTEVTINSSEDYENFTQEEGKDYAFTVADGVALTAGVGETLLPAGNVYVQGSGSLTLQGSGTDDIGYLFKGDSLTLHAEGTLDVSGFYTANTKGEAVISTQNFELSGTKSAVFSGNSSNDRGVLVITKDGKATLSDNGSVSFDSNESRYTSSITSSTRGLGAAIYLDQGAELEVSGNEDVSFSNHVVNDSGGAIYAINNYPNSINGTQNKEASITFQNNGRVSFANNKATYWNGGAIHGADITFDGQTKGVYFSGNSAQTGGAICISETGSLLFKGNETVEFTGNSATKYDGGAIYAAWDLSKEIGSVEFIGNETVIFRDNASACSGGGIHVSSRNVKIAGNTTVLFEDNKAGAPYSTEGAGAIHAGSLEISGNESVTFRGNCLNSSSLFLRALWIEGNVNVPDNAVILSAAENNHITFYDSIYVAKQNTVSINQGENNVGSIILSGKYVEEDLQRLTGSEPTAEQIENSKTSELRAQVNIYAGQLQLQEGVVLHSWNLAVKDTATLSLSNSTLDLYTNTGTWKTIQEGASVRSEPIYQLYNATFEAGSSLALEGVNTIVVDTLTATDSTWSFTLSALNASDALLDFSGTLSASNLTINLLGAESDALSGIRSLKLLTGATESQWAGVSWTGTGIEADKLRWDGTTLWYDLMAPGEYADIIVTAPQSLTSAELADPVNVIVRGGEATITSIIRKADAGSDLADKAFGNLTLESGTATIGEGGGLEGKVAYVDTDASTPEPVRELVIAWNGLSLGEVALDAAKGQNVLTIGSGNTVTVGSLTGEGGLNIRGGGVH